MQWFSLDGQGFDALEQLLSSDATGSFLPRQRADHGRLLLVPQVFNAKRFNST